MRARNRVFLKARNKYIIAIVYLENAWTSNQMITEGEAAFLLETTRRAFRNQSQLKQRSTLITITLFK